MPRFRTKDGSEGQLEEGAGNVWLKSRAATFSHLYDSSFSLDPDD